MAYILLAEDDLSMRHFLSGALEKAGHHVTACDDGTSALDALKRQDISFDLLLTDIVMPGMDGIELSQKAAALFPSLKIMFITGFSASALPADHKPDPDRPVMAKPLHLKDLIRQIDTLLAASTSP